MLLSIDDVCKPYGLVYHLDWIPNDKLVLDGLLYAVPEVPGLEDRSLAAVVDNITRSNRKASSKGSCQRGWWIKAVDGVVNPCIRDLGIDKRGQRQETRNK